MEPEEWARARELFEAAVLLTGAEREAFLDKACPNSPLLRAEVASLLLAHERSPDFIEQPVFEAAAGLFADADSASLAGRSVGPYIVRHEIGRGGMGVVYLADDTRLSRRVALKALAPEIGRDGRRRERLRHEARAAAALSHSGIATVYALEEVDDELYLACEYVPGPTLRTLIDSSPVPLSQTIDIATQLARVLVAAHAQGVVHRDLKPENVVRTAAGVVKVLDFGIARMESLIPSRLTDDGRVVGTPGYMAPEQIRGKEIDFRTDLFSFGLVVYEIASGSNPFESGSRTETLARILELDPVPLSSVCPAGSPALDRIIATCLEKDPSHRYQSTLELVQDLERLQEDTRSTSDPGAVRDTQQPVDASSSGHWKVEREGRGSLVWWWEFHQAASSMVYVLMMYPVWCVRPWLPSPWGTLFLLAVLACASAVTTLRLHLWFTSHFYPSELFVERERAAPWTRCSDAGLTVSLFAAAVGIASDHPEFAMLLVAAGVVIALTSLIIEPAASRAAFGSA